MFLYCQYVSLTDGRMKTGILAGRGNCLRAPSFPVYLSLLDKIPKSPLTHITISVSAFLCLFHVHKHAPTLSALSRMYTLTSLHRFFFSFFLLHILDTYKRAHTNPFNKPPSSCWSFAGKTEKLGYSLDHTPKSFQLHCVSDWLRN